MTSTADLCDRHGDAVRVLALALQDYGGRREFAGTITTVKVREDHVPLRAALEEAGNGRVMVVDGGGSLRCALMGDQMGALAQRNGWAGVVLFGAVRDAATLAGLEIGVRAVGTCPRRSETRDANAERDVPVTFGGVTFHPGEWLAADADGILVSGTALE